MKTILASLFLGFACTVSAADPVVYPVPQRVETYSAELTLPSVSISGTAVADPDALALLKTLVKEDASARYKIHLAQGGSARAGLTPVSGAYRLKISKDEMSVCAYDAAGMYYAMQTLSQLIKDGKVPCLEINDWPDIPFRGTVEGFYGQPWSHEARKRQFEFYGKYKLNTYIYGPKDDPFHGFSNRWREPYPADKAIQIRELALKAHEHKVNFVWAVHPGRDIRWTQADLDSCIEKFQMMYDLGVRSFGVFFDDIGGEGARGDKQVEFLNALNSQFIQKKPDVTPLIMCPTEYNRSWAKKEPGTYLDILGDRLDTSIQIMWTGNSVVHDITLEGLEWVNKRIKRPAYIWWNFPVSDYVRNRLLIGRVYGLDQTAVKEMSGFVSNPMDKPEASKITLFSIADYTWNMKAFNSDPSWRNGIRALFPACAEAVQTFADHNSDQGPNGHGYRREESVVIEPVLTAFLENYKNSGKINPSEYQIIMNEMERISKAPDAIRKHADNPIFLEETAQWLDAFQELGVAGIKTLQLIQALDAKNTDVAVSAASEAAYSLGKMRTIAERKGKTPFQSGAKTGTRVIEPFVTTLFRLASAKLYHSMTGIPPTFVTPITSSKHHDGLPAMTDRDPSSYYYCREIQKTGDWYGVDLGVVQPVRKVSVIMGRHDGDHDIVHKGQLEVSSDAAHWQALGSPSVGDHVAWSGTPVEGRFVRYRSLRAGKLDGTKDDVWTAFRDFSVNTVALPFAVSTVPLLKTLMVQATPTAISINRVMEVAQMKSGEFIQLSIPEGFKISAVKKFDLDLDVPELSTKIATQVSTDGQKWINYGAADLGTSWTMLRAINQLDRALDIKLNTFSLQFNPAANSASVNVSDGDLSTSIRLSEVPLTIENTINPTAKSCVIVADAPSLNVVVNYTNGTTQTLELKASAKGVFRIKGSSPVKSLIVKPVSDAESIVYEVFFVNE